MNLDVAGRSRIGNPAYKIAGSAQRAVAGEFPTLNGFAVQRELGRGGMGVVYQARDERLGRWVALKMLRTRDYADVESRARFRSEAEVVARLQHPNIVQIFEVGEQEGQPFLTLEFVAGGNLAQHAGGVPQPLRKAAELVALLARAVQHAHEHGVIHRDLKPANVLLSADGTPKITDFGLAKRLPLTQPSPPGGEGRVRGVQTESGIIVGTASYMAPEQAGGRSREVTAAADVYALGAILYELLTGRPPFQGESPMETILQVLHTDPVPPSRLVPKVARDLECICLKCLEKEPARRYGTASALAEDLGRFLNGEPIHARPASSWERAWKWARRRPAIAALSAAVVLVTVIGFALVTWQWRRADRGWQNADYEAAAALKARGEAEGLARTEAEARHNAQLISSRLLVEQGLNLFERTEYAHGALSLIRALETAPDSPAHAQHIRRLLDGCRSYLHRQLVVFTHTAPVRAAALSPNGQLVVTGTADGVAQVWHADDGSPMGPPLALPRQAAVQIVAFSPDSRYVLTVNNDTDICLWEASTGKMRCQLAGHTARVDALAFNTDGALLLTGSQDQTACLWDVATGRRLLAPLNHDDAVTAVAFHPAGSLFATGTANGVARLWERRTGKSVGMPLTHARQISSLVFSGDGALLATGSLDGTAQLLNARTGKPTGFTYRHPDSITAVDFHPSFAMLMTAGLDRTVRRWSTGVAGSTTQPYQLSEPVRAAAYSRNGELILVRCRNTVEVWDSAVHRCLGEPLRHRDTVHAAMFSSDGRRVLTASEDGTAILWQAPPTRPSGTVAEILARPGETAELGRAIIASLACSADATLVVTRDGSVQCNDLDTGKQRPGALSAAAGIKRALFSPDGKTVLTAGPGNSARLWNAATGALLHEYLHPAPTVTAVAFMPDGNQFVTVGGQVVQLWDTGGRKPVRELLRYQGEMSALAISPDGQMLVTANNDHTAQLWELATGTRLGEPLQHRMKISAVAFNPDGQTILTAGADFTAHLWQRTSGKQVGRRMYHGDPISGAVFSPDGTLIATCGRVTARFWDAGTGEPVGEVFRHTRLVHAMAFSPDGKSLLTANRGFLWKWRAPLPRTESLERLKLWVEVTSGMEMDDTGTVHYLDAGRWRARHEQLQRLGGPPDD
jgi:WD40 repeat protein